MGEKVCDRKMHRQNKRTENMERGTNTMKHKGQKFSHNRNKHSQ